MRRDLLLTGLSAAASAALYLSLTLGVLGAPFFAYFVQLPLLFVGLSLGTASAGLASLGALGIVILFGGSIAALVFLVVQVAPALLAIRQALLSREAADGSHEWYPSGLVLGNLVLYAAVVMAAALAWIRIATGSLETAFTTAIAHVLDQFEAAGGAASGFGQEMLDYAAIVPGIVAVSWVLMILVNATIAQFLAIRSGEAKRPAIALATLWLPRWCGPALGLATLTALLVGGDAAYLAQGLATLFAVPYLLQGLAVVHSATGRLQSRGLVLTGFYVVLLIFSWPLVVGIVLLGLLEDWAHFRRRLA